MDRAEKFALCCAQLEGNIDADTAGFARTALADSALQALLPAVLAEHDAATAMSAAATWPSSPSARPAARD